MQTIKVNRWTFKMAETWDELSPRQYLQVIELRSRVISSERLKLLLLLVLLDIRWWHFRKKWTFLLMPGLGWYQLPWISLSKDEENQRLAYWVEMQECVEFLLGEIELGDWKVELKTKGKQLQKAFNYWAIIDFAEADTWYRHYCRGMEYRHLVDLAISITENQHLEKYKSRLSLDVKGMHLKFMALFYNFQALRNRLLAQYPKVFSKSGGEDPYGWQRPLVNLAGETFGPVDKAQKAELHAVMMYWQDNAERQEKLERERNKRV